MLEIIILNKDKILVYLLEGFECYFFNKREIFVVR